LENYIKGCMSLKKYLRGCVSLKKYKSQGKAVEVNIKEENSSDFYLDSVQEFGLWTKNLWLGEVKNPMEMGGGGESLVHSRKMAPQTM
jgi:hypothetical protein